MQTKTTKGQFIGTRVNGILHHKETYKIHDTQYERKYTSPLAKWDKDKTNRKNKAISKNKENDLSNKIENIHNTARNRYYKEKLNALNADHMDGITKPICKNYRSLDCNSSHLLTYGANNI